MHNTVKLIAETEQINITHYSTTKVCMYIADFFVNLKNTHQPDDKEDQQVQTDFLLGTKIRRGAWKIDKS